MALLQVDDERISIHEHRFFQRLEYVGDFDCHEEILSVLTARDPISIGRAGLRHSFGPGNAGRAGGTVERRIKRFLTPAAKGTEPKEQVGLELAEGTDLAHPRFATSIGWPAAGHSAGMAPAGRRNSLLWYHSSDGNVKALTDVNS